MDPRKGKKAKASAGEPGPSTARRKRRRPTQHIELYRNFVVRNFTSKNADMIVGDIVRKTILIKRSGSNEKIEKFVSSKLKILGLAPERGRVTKTVADVLDRIERRTKHLATGSGWDAMEFLSENFTDMYLKKDITEKIAVLRYRRDKHEDKRQKLTRKIDRLQEGSP